MFLSLRSVEQLGSPADSEGPSTTLARKFPSKTGTLGLRSGRGGTWGSISRVFARSKTKSKALSDNATECECRIIRITIFTILKTTSR